jgi:hypothetical protein
MERCLGSSSTANSIRRQRQALSLSQRALAETVVPTRLGSVIDAVAGGETGQRHPRDASETRAGPHVERFSCACFVARTLARARAHHFLNLPVLLASRVSGVHAGSTDQRGLDGSRPPCEQGGEDDQARDLQHRLDQLAEGDDRLAGE